MSGMFTDVLFAPVFVTGECAYNCWLILMAKATFAHSLPAAVSEPASPGEALISREF